MRRLAFVLIASMLVLVSCRMDINLTGGNAAVHPGAENWMGRLSGDLRVTDIVLPGTHDTCANYDFLGLSSTAAAQDLTLKEQLEAGVRCIDIRIYNDNEVYKIHHGPQFMHMTLNDVVQTCRRFLEQNPTEFIILTAMGEYKSPRESITPILESCINSNPTLFISATEAGSMTLSEARGKIIPVLRYADPSRTCCLDTTTYSERGARYKTKEPEQNLRQGISALEACRDAVSLDKPTAVYFACYFEGQFGIPNIRIASSYINPRLQSWLKDYKGSGEHLGMIVTDHMTRDLAYAIYSCNSLSE